MFGAALWLSHPKLTTRSCDDCIRWMYDETTGERIKQRGDFVPRGKSPTPCHNCPKCPAGEEPTPNTGRKSELSAKNRRALDHFIGTRHGGLTETEKADPTVRKNRRILEAVFQRHERASLSPVKA